MNNRISAGVQVFGKRSLVEVFIIFHSWKLRLLITETSILSLIFCCPAQEAYLQAVFGSFIFISLLLFILKYWNNFVETGPTLFFSLLITKSLLVVRALQNGE